MQDNFQIIKDHWEEILLHMKQEYEISDLRYKTWMTTMEPYRYKNSVLTVLTQSEQHRIYLMKNFDIYLRVSIDDITGISCEEIEFIAQKPQDEESAKKSAIHVHAPSLNPKFTFDNFVVGKNNNLAHAASLAVSEQPGKVYNPLFIYGGVGLGKTHLMQSIGHYILDHNPNARVLYVTSEKFTNELIDSIRNKGSRDGSTIYDFRKKYRENDVLLIDDIQFIIGKESTQAEFFFTFNELHAAGRQIVITSDKPPKEFTTLEERLRSRFESGLTVDISLPDYETRMAILRAKEKLEQVNIDNEVIKYIAANIKSNIRELEGALLQVMFLGKLHGMNPGNITVEIAEEALKDRIATSQKKDLTPELIIRVVAEHYNITPDDIKSPNRSSKIAVPRQIVMYLCRNMLSIPLKTIGDSLGGRDHTTVMHGYEKIEKDMETDESLRNTVNILKKKVNAQ